MSTGIPILDDSSKAAYADLSAKQFHFVKETANGIEAINSATDKMCGVLQNKPKAGESAIVRRLGISEVKAGGIIAPGSQITTDNTGKAVAATAGTDTTKYVAGSSQDTTADGDIFTANINCLNVHRAA